MISQGSAKLTSNFGPIWFRQGDGNASIWDAIIMLIAGFSFMAALLAFLWWWYE